MPILGGGANKALDCEVERSSISTNSTSSSSNMGSSNNFTTASASKLSKFGKRIRESCRNLKGKHVKSNVSSGPSHCPQEYTSLQLPNESIRSKVYVAMDFSGEDGGRVLDNPKDIRACDKSSAVCKDGYVPFRRRIATPVAEHLTEIQATIHKSQPWYHPDLPREKANKILQAHASIDGVFLVRESSVAGGYVISYTFAGKHFHSQVLPFCCDEGVVYSVDDGRTKFYDLLQLVEFYQLNSGTLPTRLIHFIIRKDAVDGLKKGNTLELTKNPKDEESKTEEETPPRGAQGDDCPMSQDDVSEEDNSTRDQQG